MSASIGQAKLDCNQIKLLNSKLCQIAQSQEWDDGENSELGLVGQSNLMMRVFNSAKVPEISEELERNTDATDFVIDEELILEAFKFLNLFHICLSSAGCPLNAAEKQKFTSICVVLIYEYLRTDHHWSKPSLTCSAQVLLAKILQLHQVDSIGRLLQTSNTGRKTVFQSAGDILRPFLHKDRWKRDPAAVACYVSLLTELKSPAIGDCLAEIFPPMLNLIDDFELKHKLMGITCAQHVVDNTTKSELFWYGRAEVLYSALHHLLYSKEPDLIHLLLPCLLKLCKVIDFNTADKNNASLPTTKLDDVYGVFLSNMDLENCWSLRREYAQMMCHFIEDLGIQVLKHIPKTLSVVENYLEIQDSLEEATRSSALRALIKLAEVAWPRMNQHLCRVMQLLVKLVVDICYCSKPKGDSNHGKLLSLIQEVVLVMSLLNKSSVLEILDSVLNSDVINADVKSFVKQLKAAV